MATSNREPQNCIVRIREEYKDPGQVGIFLRLHSYHSLGVPYSGSSFQSFHLQRVCHNGAAHGPTTESLHLFVKDSKDRLQNSHYILSRTSAYHQHTRSLSLGSSRCKRQDVTKERLIPGKLIILLEVNSEVDRFIS